LNNSSKTNWLDVLQELYPDASCELVHVNPYELLIAVILSAQTTDKAVNLVTPALFAAYPRPIDLAQADIHDVERILQSIGLYRNKAANIKRTAIMLVEDYQGEVPASRTQLMKLPGVGRKTANVVLSVAFHIPAVPMDTHVERIAKRLGLAKASDDVLKVEEKLRRKIPRNLWNVSHHQMIHFGRYFCTAKSPNCDACQLTSQCNYFKKSELKSTKKSKVLI
jgi:endonuclease III